MTSVTSVTRETRKTRFSIYYYLYFSILLWYLIVTPVTEWHKPSIHQGFSCDEERKNHRHTSYTFVNVLLNIHKVSLNLTSFIVKLNIHLIQEHPKPANLTFLSYSYTFHPQLYQSLWYLLYRIASQAFVMRLEFWNGHILFKYPVGCAAGIGEDIGCLKLSRDRLFVMDVALCQGALIFVYKSRRVKYPFINPPILKKSWPFSVNFWEKNFWEKYRGKLCKTTNLKELGIVWNLEFGKWNLELN